MPTTDIPSTSTQAVVQDRPSPRLRLEFLDGMRGLAALYVVLSHVQGGLTEDGLPASLQRAGGFLNYGHYAVAVFIVLSGFCLMLPVVRTPDGQLQGGVFAYIKRRARRILPPYYAAVLFSLAIIAFTPVHHGVNKWWDVSLPAFTPGRIGSHLLLLHNLSTHWLLTINAPFWSVATEWQIYFVFALCLLPLWRRFGMKAVLFFSLVPTLLPYMVWRNLHFEFACPWYLGLFAMGMAGATLCNPKSDAPSWSRRAPWLPLSLVCFGIVVAIHLRWAHPGFWYVDPIIGAAVSCFILYCSQSRVAAVAGASGGHDRFGITRLLESRPAIRLGAFSYSLYLTHWPLQALMHLLLKRQGLAVSTQYYLLMSLGVPLCLGIAYGFHLLFERPFMSTRPSAHSTAKQGRDLPVAKPSPEVSLPRL